MFPRTKRLQTEFFKELSKKGRVFNSPSVSCRVIGTPKGQRFSIVVLKGAVKGAVERNKIRRRGYDIIKKNLSSLPQNKSIIFFIKGKMTFRKLEEEILSLFPKMEIKNK